MTTELTENQQKIYSAITWICDTEPFATVSDIADQVDLTKQTVLNNVDTVVEEMENIESRTVGQANVYYENSVDITEKIWNEESQSVGRLYGSGRAAYYEVRNAPSDNDFDFLVKWYGGTFEELVDYVPTNQEIGEASAGYHTDPVAIKYYDEPAPELFSE